jgi:hypothetical protein
MAYINVDKLGQFRVDGHSDAQHKQLGRCEVGSFFERKRNEMYHKGAIKPRGGEKWSLIVPSDDNASVNTVAQFDDFSTFDVKGLMCSSIVSGRALGVLFPVRGDPDAIQVGMGSVFDVFTIVAVPTDSVQLDSGPSVIYSFRVSFYLAKELLGEADVVPNTTSTSATKNMPFNAYRAAPAPGQSWLGERGQETITVKKADFEACLDGRYVPWSQQVPSLLELAIMKLYKSL